MNITLANEQHPVRFTAYTAKLMYELTGINLYDVQSLTKVFREYEEGEKATPTDVELIAKFAYCAMAAGVRPDNAPDNWVPDFTVETILNKMGLNEQPLYMELIKGYIGVKFPDFMKEVEKNELAPTLVEQK